MPNASDSQYLLVVEWDKATFRPDFVVLHRLTLPTGMQTAEFEKLIVETVLPELTAGRIHAGAIENAYFRKADKAESAAGLGTLDLHVPLPPGVQNDATSYLLIGSSRREPSA